MRVRRVIDNIWNWLGQDRRAVELFSALLLVQLTTLLLPQSPVPATQSAGFTQWVAQLRPTLGKWVGPLTFFGFLTLRSSIIMRMILAFLGLLVVVRIDYLSASWHTLRPMLRFAALLFCLGGVLIIGGWAIQMIWGWAEPDIVIWPNTPFSVETHNVTLSAKPQHPFLLTEKYGLYLIRTGWGVGLDIKATDSQGNPLPMLRSSKDNLREQLQVILTGSPPEAFFSTPKTELIYRLHQLENGADAPLMAQVYRSASGELLAETPLTDGENLVVEGTSVSITRTKLSRYRLLYNPGAPIEGIGILAIAVSISLQWRETKNDKKQPDIPEETMEDQT